MVSTLPAGRRISYIDCDYNRWRRYSACGGLSPEQFENRADIPPQRQLWEEIN